MPEVQKPILEHSAKEVGTARTMPTWLWPTLSAFNLALRQRSTFHRRSVNWRWVLDSLFLRLYLQQWSSHRNSFLSPAQKYRVGETWLGQPNGGAFQSASCQDVSQQAAFSFLLGPVLRNSTGSNLSGKAT